MNVLNKPKKFLASVVIAGTIFSTSAFGAESTERETRGFPLNMVGNISPWNKEAEMRPYTRYIVLHTTGASDKSSINSIKNDGSAHYVINTNGEIHLIVLEDKIANHAGESIWDGKTQLNYYSLGVEIVGYSEKELTGEQYNSLGFLVKYLQGRYEIPDENVLSHAAVAYSISNNPFIYACRGRKVDGININMQRLGIYARPIYDPDVLSGIVVPSPNLEKILYPAQFLAKNKSVYSKKKLKKVKS